MEDRAHTDAEGHAKGHSHSEGGGHSHAHLPADLGKAFAIGTFLNVAYVVVQVVFGMLAHSLALLSDAGHNLSDVLGLLVAWGALRLGQRPPSERRTYGMKRSSILAALANAIFLLLAVGGVSWEAVRRFSEPGQVEGWTVAWVAFGGILVNGGTAFLFREGRQSDLNVRGAFLHMASDAMISAGVVISGVVILLTGWQWVDPVVSLLVNAVVVWGTWGLLRDSLNLALDAVPSHIDVSSVRHYLATLPAVRDVHHLHIWPLSTTETALTVHLVTADLSSANSLIGKATGDLRNRFGIDHATIQCELWCANEECEPNRENNPSSP